MKSLGIIILLGVVVIWALYSPALKPFFKHLRRRKISQYHPKNKRCNQNPYYICLLIGILAILFASPANSETLTQLIISKKIMGDLTTDAIFSSSLKHIPNKFPSTQPILPIRSNYSPLYSSILSSVPNITKTYFLSSDSNTYESLIVVKEELTKQIIKYISVGRRAIKFVPNTSINRFYVLCSGYFGDVWEIDAINDMVIKKMPTIYDPTDMVLSPYGQKVYVSGSKIQEISLVSGQKKADIELPDSVGYIKKMFLIAKNKIGLIPEYKKGGSYPYLYLDIDTNTIHNLGYSPFPSVNPLKLRMKLPILFNDSMPSDCFLVASQNNDFISLVSPSTKSVAGLIPLDAGVDNILVTQDKTKVFVLHKLLGEVSVIVLKPGATQRFAVVNRIIDKRLEANDLQLAQDADKIYVWDGEDKIIVSIDINTYYPMFDKPFGDIKLLTPKEKRQISVPARKVFYLKYNNLFVEDMQEKDDKSPKKAEKITNNIDSIILSKEQKFIYATNFEENNLTVFDVSTLEPVQTISLGLKPRDLIINRNKDELYVLNSQDGSISIVDLKTYKITNTFSFDAGFHNEKTIKLYDTNLKQLVNITLPVYTSDALEMASIY